MVVVTVVVVVAVVVTSALVVVLGIVVVLSEADVEFSTSVVTIVVSGVERFVEDVERFDVVVGLSPPTFALHPAITAIIAIIKQKMTILFIMLSIYSIVIFEELLVSLFPVILHIGAYVVKTP